MKHLLILFFCSFLFSVTGQDSLNMVKMAQITGLGSEYNDIWGYRHGAKEYAVVGSNIATNILDVTDCSNPVLVHQWVDGSTVIWRDFKDYGDYIYGICDGGACNEGLEVINKNDFSHSQSQAVFTRAHNIFVEKKTGKLYVVGTSTTLGHIIVYDVKTDPGNPILLKKVYLNQVPNGPSGNFYIHDIYVRNDTAYCSHGYDGFRVWDLTDLDNVSFIGDYVPTVLGYNHSSWLHPDLDYAIVAEEVPIGHPMHVYDLSDLANITQVTSFKDPLEAPTYTNNRPHNPFIQRNRLFISYYHDGLQVYDFSDPGNPYRIAYYDTYLQNNGNGYSGYHGAWGTYPFLPSGCLLVSDIENGFFTLKLDLIPDTQTKNDRDIFIADPSSGVVFVTSDKVWHRMKITNSGTLDIQSLPSKPVSKVEAINSNVGFSPGKGVIFTAPNGSKHRLRISSNGTLFTEPVVFLPSKLTKITQNDLILSQFKAGLILKVTQNIAFHVTVDKNDNTEVTAY